MFTACSESIDNPVSAVDDKQWNVTDEIMDKSVSPGDDFYMYCTGGYWNSTVADEEIPNRYLFFEQMEIEMINRVNTLVVPSYTKFSSDVDNMDAEAIKAQKAQLQSAIDRVDALTTKEEAWKLVAELMNEGYRTPFEFYLFSLNGKMGIILTGYQKKDYENSRARAKESRAWRIANDPELLARVRPLKRAATRGFDNEEWPMMVTIFNTLQIPLDDVYILDYFGGNTMSYLQDCSVEVWKYLLKEYLKEDAVYFDKDAAAAVSSTCYRAAYNFMLQYTRYELSRVFDQTYVSAELKQQLMGYAEELRQTFINKIQKCDWLSDASKQNAIEKMKNMIFYIGAPDEWFDEGVADLSQESTLYDDIRAYRRAIYNLQRKLTGMRNNKAVIHNCLITNALTSDLTCRYYLSGNYLVIVPAFILPPGYDPLTNDAHNYANMTVWSHEMAHGFSPTGVKYDKDGNLGTLWANEADGKEFQKRTEQLADYYSSIEIFPFETGLKNDGAYTLNENVADLEGFLMAYDTYARHLERQGFSGQQLLLQKRRFYEAYAYVLTAKWTADWALMNTGDPARPQEKDVHSLNRERVNGVVANTDDWYRLFDVKPTDKLYLAPEDRVRIW